MRSYIIKAVTKNMLVSKFIRNVTGDAMILNTIIELNIKYDLEYDQDYGCTCKWDTTVSVCL